MYSDVSLFIDGRWTLAKAGRTIPVMNPATGDPIGNVARAEKVDLDLALAAAKKGYETWRNISAYDRAKIMRKAAKLMREHVDRISPILTTEQGKLFAEARGETEFAADIIEWFAEEARRTYGRVVPSRNAGVYQLVIKEPVGIAAAFTPWNFPLIQAVRKISAALAAGCSIILKGPEETPGSCAALVQLYADAGVPEGVINLVFGVPSEISTYLIAHPAVRKVSFTGSTAVGKQLAALAGAHMKRVTMELGGHAPVIIFDDADLDVATRLLSANKFRNAGQICTAPTRFIVQEKVYDNFVDRFVKIARELKVGDGMDPSSQMGPLAHDRRVAAMEGFISDAVQKGAEVLTGGQRIGNKGYFFQPTVLANVPKTARAMNEEPFGPVAMIAPFHQFDEAVEEANRLPYGLAAYAYTRSAKTANAIADAVETGMISINHHGLGLPEVPNGGVKDSGYGSEGGIEAIESYLVTKLVSQAGA
ncbi:MAG: NAD-dependent succinate-semialdehyde dehydrogenase [Acetobacteraceae bacterium]